MSPSIILILGGPLQNIVDVLRADFRMRRSRRLELGSRRRGCRRLSIALPLHVLLQEAEAVIGQFKAKVVPDSREGSCVLLCCQLAKALSPCQFVAQDT